MATDQNQRTLIALSVFLAIIGVGLIVASFATDHWIKSEPIRTNTTVANNSTTKTKLKKPNEITFGLFRGYESMDYGFGSREYYTEIECDLSENACAFVKESNQLKTLISEMNVSNSQGENKSMEDFGLFDFRLYVAVLVTLVLALSWGLVAIGYSIFNVFGRPIMTITGRSSLYVWNLLALLFDVAAISIYVVLYSTQLKENIITSSAHRSGFSSQDNIQFDFSFFLIIGAAGAFLFNIIILFLANRGCSCSYTAAGEKEVDNGMILY